MSAVKNLIFTGGILLLSVSSTYSVSLDACRQRNITPLMKACFNADLREVKKCLQNGESIFASSSSGEQPLHFVALAVHKNRAGNTPEQLTNLWVLMDIATMLRNRGASTRAQNDDGKCPLAFIPPEDSLKPWIGHWRKLLALTPED